MTYLVERLAELRRHMDHLRDLRPRVTGRQALEQDLSLHNDVLFSLLMLAQLVMILQENSQRAAGTGSRTTPMPCGTSRETGSFRPISSRSSNGCRDSGTS